MMGPFPEAEYDFIGEETERDSRRPDTAEADIDRGDVRLLLRQDAEFFIEFFLGDELEYSVPEIHKTVWGLFTDTSKDRILLAIPRDHAKTTLAKLGIIWYFLFTSHRFCVYLTAVNTKAKDACRDVMNFLKCDNFRSVFGDVRIIKESETESIWIFDLPLGNGQWKRCILRAAGTGQSMRGINIDNQRPDIAVIDDAEDEDNSASPQLQAKLDRWMFGTFLKALARRKKIIWLGNMLNDTSLLARLSKRENWNPVVFGAIVRDETTGLLRALWPDRWTLEALIEDFQEYRSLGLVKTWMCEMMNMPGHGENGFTEEQINYKPIPAPDSILAAWICIDPAFGEDAEHDLTSITVHVLPEDGPPMVVAESSSRMLEADIFEEAYRLGQYWNAWAWGIESVAAQKVLITLFRTLSIVKGMANQIEFLPLMSGGKAKSNRISAWVSMMEHGEYALFEGALDITTQILKYDKSKKKQADDLIDSCAYGPIMLDNYQGLIISQFQGRKLRNLPEARFGRRVAGV